MVFTATQFEEEVQKNPVVIDGFTPAIDAALQAAAKKREKETKVKVCFPDKIMHDILEIKDKLKKEYENAGYTVSWETKPYYDYHDGPGPHYPEVNSDEEGWFATLILRVRN
ncbi:MAG: hypothetical protein ACM3UU_05290 [Ignavibacteriales bacterium]